jgi:hypothetical protein
MKLLLALISITACGARQDPSYTDPVLQPYPTDISAQCKNMLGIPKCFEGESKITKVVIKAPTVAAYGGVCNSYSDGHKEILINPDILKYGDGLVYHVLAHEYAHCALGAKHEDGGLMDKVTYLMTIPLYAARQEWQDWLSKGRTK